MKPRELIERALARGAFAAETYVKRSRHMRIDMEGATVTCHTAGLDTGAALRLFTAEGSQSFAAASGCGGPDLDRALSDLRAAPARASGLLAPLASGPVPQIEIAGLRDPLLTALPVDRKRAFLERARAAADSVMSGRIHVTALRWDDLLVEHRLSNSAGLDAGYEETLCSASISVLSDKKGSTVPAGAFAFGRSPAAMDPERLGREAALRAILPLGGRAVPTGTYTALVDGSVTVCLVRSFADQCLERWSGLRGDDGVCDSPYLGAMTTLIDDGLLPGGLASAPFDGEGTPRQTTSVVKCGVLMGRLHDRSSAAAARDVSTGNAVRLSYARPPSRGMTNFFFEPGTRRPADILGDIPDGLYIMNCLAPPHGRWEKPGWISVPVSGARIRHGRLSSPLSGVALKAPVAALFEAIAEAASDLVFLPGQGAFGAPSVLVEGAPVEAL